MAVKFLVLLAWALPLSFLLVDNGADAISPLQAVRERGFLLPGGKGVLGQGHAKAHARYSSAAGEHRLPSSIVPSHYSLTIIPVLDKNDPTLGEAFGTALGNIAISVECAEPSSSVTLHASREFVKIAADSVKVSLNAQFGVNSKTSDFTVTSHGVNFDSYYLCC